MEVKTYEEHGCKIVEDVLPEGWTVVDSYEPCSSVCPWDCYGHRHQQEYSKVLAKANIECLLLEVRRSKLYPRGTGPHGRVRSGDEMLPGIYKVAVRTADQVQACVAITEHKAEIAKWLADFSYPMPEACRD